MTKIRKINVSQVEGSDANNTDINEIRPFGETAFYLDTNGDTNKLVLMMFDGIRTHRKSKILSPGVLFGSNADSGDGAGLDTIKLIPDATLHYDNGNYNNHQHLIVDPTAPNHIHIRAGGTIDNSNADLFLGGELTHIKVSDNQDNVVIRTSVVGEGIAERNWVFDNSGNLTFPFGGTFDGAELVPPLDFDFVIRSNKTQLIERIADPDSGENQFRTAISENDDILVVQPGWTVVVGGTTYSVYQVDTVPGLYSTIYAGGATFVPGETYYFRSNTATSSVWNFVNDGTLITPGQGTISHRNNDLKVEVTGTDVIVLRTAGGDIIVNADASLTFNDGISKISVLDPAQSGGVGGLSVNGKDRTYIGISSDVFGYNWDFRAFGLNDETTEKPTIMFPGGGWLQEDISDIANGGFNVPTQLGSQGAFTLTVKNNSNFPAPPSAYNWTFGTDGRTTFPNGTVPEHSYGASGDKEGMVAFDGSYIYYCTQDFAAEPYSTTIVTTYSGLYPDIVKGSIPQPQAGWAFVHNGTTYTLASNAVENNPGEWNCELTTSISVTAGDTVTVGPASSADIWKRVAWSVDTW